MLRTRPVRCPSLAALLCLGLSLVQFQPFDTQVCFRHGHRPTSACGHRPNEAGCRATDLPRSALPRSRNTLSAAAGGSGRLADLLAIACRWALLCLLRIIARFALGWHGARMSKMSLRGAAIGSSIERALSHSHHVPPSGRRRLPLPVTPGGRRDRWPTSAAEVALCRSRVRCASGRSWLRR